MKKSTWLLIKHIAYWVSILTLVSMTALQFIEVQASKSMLLFCLLVISLLAILIIVLTTGRSLLEDKQFDQQLRLEKISEKIYQYLRQKGVYRRDSGDIYSILNHVVISSNLRMYLLVNEGNQYLWDLASEIHEYYEKEVYSKLLWEEKEILICNTPKLKETIAIQELEKKLNDQDSIIDFLDIDYSIKPGD